ncbi:zinc-binding alcohol dehydrogenase-containing protein cipB [Coleophoma crateriformis]|uniref:Zinc-binding alcohol dehydrogenase-containing protein cipB n=1 Tax=Coleophoma crateriformis TaxID=565419 RepID=A0A3D8SJK6_9HELO|nr:zinc-binding alcohol dehydrogenase-containing protein cipB [Coleophoma crateriformis]
MPSNRAVIVPDKGQPLEIREVPNRFPKPDEIVVESRAVAVNPVDVGVQLMGPAIFPFLKYPAIIGFDVAGEVIEVGSGVTRFKVGDRVLGYAAGFLEQDNTRAAFQDYPILHEALASPIPNTMAYEEAVVLPLALLAAAWALFQKSFLGLAYPSVQDNKGTSGETVLIWGGSTSVGCNAIQLAVAAGYEVITTASPKNFNLTKKLGASQVFDYHSATVVQDIVEAFRGKSSAGALCIGGTSVPSRKLASDACFEIVSRIEGNKFISMAMPVPEDKPEDVGAKFIAKDSDQTFEVGKIIFEDFLPSALAKGTILPYPEARVVGSGWQSVQKALDMLQKGVSATKLVVTL